VAYHLYQPEAFILDEREIGESNKIYYLLTDELGLVIARAQGVRLLKSKLRYHLDRYSCARVVLVRGKENWRLVGSEKTEIYRNIFTCNQKLKSVIRVFSFLQKFIQGESPHPTLYRELKKALVFLDELDSSMARDRTIYLWEQVVVFRLLHQLGYIRDLPKLSYFITKHNWDQEILIQAEKSSPSLIKTINEAIEASHI